MPPPQLPLEIIFHIIESHVPDLPAPLVRSDGRTAAALRTWTQVCRRTYPVATRLIRRHCMLINNGSIFFQLLKAVRLPDSPLLRQRDTLGSITSLCISMRGYHADHLEDLFDKLAGTLKRLIINMSLRFAFSQDVSNRMYHDLADAPADGDEWPFEVVVRAAFSKLVNLEEFVSVQDELCLGLPARIAGKPIVWTLWPELRRLALFNVKADDTFWHLVAGMLKLECLVLTRPDGLEDYCVKACYFAKTDRPIKLKLVNSRRSHLEELPTHLWQAVDPDNDRMEVTTVYVPFPFFRDEDEDEYEVSEGKPDPESTNDEDEDMERIVEEIERCQAWVMTGALKGTLWTERGIVRHARYLISF